MNARIVVADGDADMRHFVVSTLRQRGCHLSEAVDSANALDLIRAAKPDLIVLALGMADQEGVTVTQTLNADPKLAIIPVMLLTPKDKESELKSWLQSGIHDCLIKPFAPHDLVTRVERMLAAAHGHGGQS